MRKGMRRGVYLLPSLFTIGNLLCGFYAIVAVYNDDYPIAALAILVALVLDFLDGAVARITNSSSDFGIELDSLADLVSFGVAPAVLAYVWALRPFERLGWLACFLFVICGALRLARFNIQARNLDKRYFVGLPIPAAAGLVASFVLFMKDSSSFTIFEWEILSPEFSSWLVAILVYTLSFLMVSKVRYRSLKGIDIKRRHPITILVGVTLALLVIASQPSLLLFAIFFGYALSGLWRYLPLPRKRPYLIEEAELRDTHIGH